MKNRRLMIFLIWTLLTVLGAVLWGSLYDPYFTAYYILGFRTPINASSMLVFFGLMDYYPPLCSITAWVLPAGLILWVITLLRINKGRMFEALIVVDRIAALLLWITFAITEAEDFIGWIYLAGLAVETVAVICLLRPALRHGWLGTPKPRSKPTKAEESNKE